MKLKSYFHYVFLILTTIFTRIFLFKDFFHEWDPINFALAINKFDIYTDQPHPPGYPIVVLFSKILFFFIKDHLRTLQILSLIISIISVIIFYLFIFKLTNNKNYAFITSIVFSFTPIFFFYGIVEDVYIFEALITLLFGYFAYLTINNKKYFPYFSIIYGLIGGIRFNDLLFFFPLFVYVFLKSKINFKEISKNFLLILITILSLYIPVILSGGGYKMYSYHSKSLFTWVFGTSIFYENNYWYNITFKNCILFIKDCFISIIFLVYFFIKDKNYLCFFILWILPSLLFYFLIHTPKVGYYLTIIPAVYLFLFYKLYKVNFNFKKLFFLILIAIILLNSIYLFTIINKNLYNQIWVIKYILNSVETNIDDENSVIFIFDETVNYFRPFQWYLENHKIYYLTNTNSYIIEWNIKNGYILMDGRKPFKIFEGNIIDLNKDTKELIFITNRPEMLYDLLELKETQIKKNIGTLKGSGLTIISFKIDENFDHLFVRGYIIKLND